MNRLFVFTCVLFLVSSSAEAQTASRPLPTTRATVIQQPAGPTIVRPAIDPATAGGPSEAAAAQQAAQQASQRAQQRKQQEAQNKQQRMQLIQQLQFDRRPSAILKAWADAKKPKTIADSNQLPPTPAGRTVAIYPPKAPNPSVFGLGPDPALAMKKFRADIQALRTHATLGQWKDVKRILAGFEANDGKMAYRQMLMSLLQGPVPVQPQQPQPYSPYAQPVNPNMMMETNTFRVEDVTGLADAAPMTLESSEFSQLGSLLRQAIQAGTVIEEVVEHFQQLVTGDQPPRWINNRNVARLMFAAGQSIHAGKFLPSIEEATANDDQEYLNMLSQHYLALHAKEKKPEQLRQAWDVTQAVLSSKRLDEKQKTTAMRRAVELAPRVSEELGAAWLHASFVERPERGIEILAAIGSQTSQNMQRYLSSPTRRKQDLVLQQTAVEALLKAAPEQADKWRQTLNLLASNWLREAKLSFEQAESTSMGPRMERDAFGNLYFVADDPFANRMYRPNMIRPITPTDMLEHRPSQDWLDLLDSGLKPKFAMMFAQLYLKVQEEKLAFPFIAMLAETHPEQAKELANDFLDIWTANHDPNSARRRTNPYMYMYGFDRKAESIPLTRSKQERNLKELAEWVGRLRELPIGELDEQRLTRAFTTCHSSAEVYRIDAIQMVFGSVTELEPRSLSSLIQQMRANLNGMWRDPALQKKSGTNRKKKDIQAEVQRGYQVAKQVVNQALDQHTDNWRLLQVKAALIHDENNYNQEIERNSEFTQRRGEAFALFKQAAQLYIQEAMELPEDEHTSAVFEQWFYASLGACDLQHIDAEKQPAAGQPEAIRAALESLEGDLAEKHLDRFASSLFTRMSALNPAVKFRYLRYGFEIAGDRKAANEARKVLDYYSDLVTELKLETQIDGADEVGNGEPFGVFVNLRHTPEIERESGGFAKYTQNQNNMYYSYNYGRPLENYRDKFEEAARQALQEDFEVMSITFNSDEPNSKATEEYGWRRTPYAYVLLKARGPQVDRLPSLGLDLDFLDTSGYVVLPIESAVLPLDSSKKNGEPSVVEELSITQIVDERQAKDGKLLLEVKATARGLVPEFESLIDFNPAEFNVDSIEDQGLAVSRFDKESSATAVISERAWTISMTANPELNRPPTQFEFGAPRVDVKEVLYQRYVDADLASVERMMSLEEQYASSDTPWGLLIGMMVGGLLLGSVVIWLIVRSVSQSGATTSRYQLPEDLTPFAVLGLLQDIDRNNGLDEARRQELRASISRVERHYFADADADDVDLRKIAEHWVAYKA